MSSRRLACGAICLWILAASTSGSPAQPANGNISGVIEGVVRDGTTVKLSTTEDGPIIASAFIVPLINRVRHLEPGAFEFRALAPGTYFLSVESAHRVGSVLSGEISAVRIVRLERCDESKEPATSLSDADVASAIGIAARLSAREFRFSRLLIDGIRPSWLTDLPSDVKAVTSSDLERMLRRAKTAYHLALTVRPGSGCVFVDVGAGIREKRQNEIVRYVSSHDEYEFRRNGRHWDFDVDQHRVMY